MVFLYETFRHLFWKKGPLYGLTVAADSELMSLLLSVDCSCQAVYWIFFLLFFLISLLAIIYYYYPNPSLDTSAAYPFPRCRCHSYRKTKISIAKCSPRRGGLFGPTREMFTVFRYSGRSPRGIQSRNLSLSSSGKLRTLLSPSFFLPFFMHHVHASAVRTSSIIHYYPQTYILLSPCRSR